MAVYILALSQPLGNPDTHQARYYVGSCADQDVYRRLETHRKGQGAKMTRYAARIGIQMDVIAILPGGRKEERQIKNRKNTPRLVEQLRRKGKLLEVMTERNGVTMNKSIGSIHEYKDRFEVANPFGDVLNTIYRDEMTPAQTRMMERLITRFCSECFEIEKWVDTRHSGYFEDCTLRILSDRRREFCRRGQKESWGI